MTILQLTKVLLSPPRIAPLPEIAIRNYGGPADIGPWLALRHRAFARQKVGVRHWDEADFQREFLDKPWWSAERLWLAESVELETRLVGTVALAARAGGNPAVHWLAVDPRFRRRGIGQWLIAHLEAFCWERGDRQIWLETHEAWQAALGLYRSLGYQPVHD